MKKIMVIGVSAGAGKSTLAKEIGKLLGIEVCHLDRLYWRPGWIEASNEEFEKAQREILKQDQWLIEGNYSSTFSLRSEKADTIVYIEHSIYVCFYRVIKRWLTNLGSTRSDMAEGCPEKLDWKFIKFIATTYYPRKKMMATRLVQFQKEGKTVFILKSNKEIVAFLNNLNNI